MGESRFTKWNMTEEEVTAASALTISQRQLVQTDIAYIAEELTGLELDVAAPEKYWQQHASLVGKIQHLEYMIERSDAATSLNNPNL